MIRCLIVVIYCILLTSVIGQTCNQGFYNDNNDCKACPGGQYQNQNNYAGSSCITWSTCNAGEKETLAPDAQNDRTCGNCGSGQYQSLNNYIGTSCVTWSTCNAGEKETLAPDAQNDLKTFNIKQN